MAEERMLNDEILLGLIKANSGGGGGGTTDYDDLSNKPQIGGVTLSGNKSASDLGLATTTDLEGKQDALTFDTVPTDGSTNPVQSNGVYDALALKQDILTFDNAPTENSNNPVKSGGVYAADKALEEWTSAETKSETGNPIMITDGAALNAKGLVMTIEPIQAGSGTPSPENVRAISGISSAEVETEGKNKLPLALDVFKTLNTYGTWNGNVYSYNGIDYEVLEDEAGNIVGLKVNGATTSNSSVFTLTSKLSCEWSNFSAKSMILSGTVNNVYVQFWSNVASYRDEGSGVAITFPSEVPASWNIALYVDVNTTISNTTVYPMIRLASVTDASFEPYMTHSATISLGGTVYGGTVDFNTGVMTVDRAYAELDGTETWYVSQSDNTAWFYTQMSGMVTGGSQSLPCNRFESDVSQRWTKEDNAWGQYGQVHIRPDSTIAPSGQTAEGLAEFKTWLGSNNLQVVYPLATPTTTQLTPAQLELLKGYNTVTANGASISLVYQPENLKGEILEEVQPQIDSKQNATDNALNTTAKTVVGGINELKSGLTEDVAELQSELDEQSTTHVVLSIPANTYNTREAALAAMYTAYNALSSDRKRRAYIIWEDTVYRSGYMPNGYFSAIFPRLDDGSSAWISQIIIIDLEHKNMLSSLLGASGTTTTNLKSNAQDVDVSLCY